MTISKCLTDLSSLFKTGATIQSSLDEKIEVATRMKELFSKAIIGLGASLLLAVSCVVLLSMLSASSILTLPLSAVSSVLLVGCLLSSIGFALISAKGRALLEEKELELQAEAKQTRKQSVSSEAASELEAGEDLETRGQEEVDGPFDPKRPVSTEEEAVKVVKVEEPEGGTSTEEESDPIEGSPVAGASEEGFEGEKVKGGAGTEEKSPTETELGTTSTQTSEGETSEGAAEKVADNLKVVAFEASESDSEDEEEAVDSLMSRLGNGISAMKELFVDAIKVLRGEFLGAHPGSSIPHLGSKDAKSPDKKDDELKYEDFDS
ncbi:hypothetical protein [Chlamydiifrater volucris]|uniref:hypothetical protein n=1 Tax=Chlamydiifrater volucris TaxID=2681470 RepID=UPI0032B1A213